MSDTQCQAGDNTGFPIKLSQSLYSNWPGTDNASKQLQKSIAPTDFSVNWGTSTANLNLRVANNTGSDPQTFLITGISSVTSSTTLVLGNANYKCSDILSIVGIQHQFLSQDASAQYEVILSFQCTNKQQNPSSPDIILLCRPIVFISNGTNSPFWAAVDAAVLGTNQDVASSELPKIYGYNSSLLMPMTTYQTCLPVKVASSGSPILGSIRVRVNVVPQPIYIAANGLKNCPKISRYTFTDNPVSVFNLPSTIRNQVLQFSTEVDSSGKVRFPAGNGAYLIPPNQNAIISAFTDVIQKFQILVPEAFLGKSLADIIASDANKPPRVSPKNKAYKCFTVDPTKDIKNGQILIDPTTGESLADTQAQLTLDAAGGDASLLSAPNVGPSGLMPGDLEQMLTITVIVVMSIVLLAYFGFIGHMIFFGNDTPGIKIMHVIIFIVLLTGLTFFSIYFEDNGKFANATNANTYNPTNMNFNPNTNGTTKGLNPNTNGATSFTTGIFNKASSGSTWDPSQNGTNLAFGERPTNT